MTQTKIPLGHTRPPKITEWCIGFHSIENLINCWPWINMDRGQNVCWRLQPTESRDNAKIIFSNVWILLLHNILHIAVDETEVQRGLSDLPIVKQSQPVSERAGISIQVIFFHIYQFSCFLNLIKILEEESFSFSLA